MTSRTQNRRTSTPNSPPAGLLPGELAVEMAEPRRLWMGVPTALDATGRKLLIDGDPALLMTKSYVDGANAAQDAVIANKVDKAGDTMTGALITPLGTAALPAIGVGATTTGIYNNGGTQINFSTSGVNRLSISSFAISPAAQMRHVNGTAAAPSYGFVTDLTSGLYMPAAASVAMSISGAQIVTWSATAATYAKQVILPATTTTAASLRMPPGTAPTTPVDGDIWLASPATLQLRGNNTTYTLAFLNGTQTFNGIKNFTAKPTMTVPTTATASVNLPHGVAPTAPVNGDLWTTTAGTYAQVNGATVGPLIAEAPNDAVQYVRQGLAWTPVNVPPGTVVSDTAPVTPQSGQMWLKSSTLVLYCWYVDGTSNQWVQVSASPQVVDQNYSRKTASRKNMIVNGALTVSQENGNTEGTTSGYFGADQWYGNIGGSSVAFGFSRVAVDNTSGSKYRLQYRVTTAKASLAAGDFASIQTVIEGLNIQDLGWNTTSPKDAVVVFNFKGPAGTYCAGIRNWTGSAVTHSFMAVFTITAGQANTDTVQTIRVPAPAGMTTWAGDIAVGLYLSVTLASGSTLLAPTAGWNSGFYIGVTGMSNGLAAVQTFQIWDIYFGADPDKTGLAPPFEVEDYATTLAKCQRYWVSQYLEAGAYNTAGGLLRMAAFHKASMRIAPTIAYTGTGYSNGSGVTTNSSRVDSFAWNYTVTAAGNSYCTTTYTATARM